MRKGVFLTFRLEDNFLVPRHDVISKEQASELMKKYGLSPEKLPQILLEDPIVEEIGAKRGDVLRITRKSPTAGESIYFRIVV